ncbi:hypothetical protein ENBRE01_0713 [Enteropsectra breve]|nr:hypothetical protein ENBRE01_0713 [Enteropsectra breve]
MKIPVTFINFWILNISANSDGISIQRSPFNTYTAADKMILVPIPCLNEKIENNAKCHFCTGQIINKEEAEICTSEKNHGMNVNYGNVSIKYFRCPQCDCIGHLNCLFEKSEHQIYECPNPQCKLVFKSNDLYRLFAQLFYVFLYRDANFKDFKRTYNLYLKKKGSALPMQCS